MCVFRGENVGTRAAGVHFYDFKAKTSTKYWIFRNLRPVFRQKIGRKTKNDRYERAPGESFEN